jgi:hypothetical protein
MSFGSAIGPVFLDKRLRIHDQRYNELNFYTILVAPKIALVESGLISA